MLNAISPKLPFNIASSLFWSTCCPDRSASDRAHWTSQESYPMTPTARMASLPRSLTASLILHVAPQRREGSTYAGRDRLRLDDGSWREAVCGGRSLATGISLFQKKNERNDD